MESQPDFGTISETFGVLSQQFARCANLPAVNGGAEVLALLQGIQQSVNLLHASLAEVNMRITRMEARSAAVSVSDT